VKKVLAAAFVVLSSGAADAADMPVAYPAPVAPWSWTGFYVGAHVGGGATSSQFSDFAGTPIYGDKVRGPAGFAGAQLGYNWQFANTGLVLGAEADAAGMSSYGSMTCFAVSGFFVSANCRVRPDAIGSFTGRIGWAMGPQGHALVYLKGGAAWLDDRVDVTVNRVAPMRVSSFNDVRWGWTAGAGVERALTPAWSLRLEYDYAKLSDFSMTVPASFVQIPFVGYVPTSGGTTSVSQNLQTAKLALNYKIGQDLHARWEPLASDYRLRGTTDAGFVPVAEVEVGGRVWYASGRFQKDYSTLVNPTSPNDLISRLSYDATSASGEVFGRIDTTSNIFLKGFVGGGRITSGSMHDEDWVIFNQSVPYSNTLSSVSGSLVYGTIDVGYSLFRGPSANVGGFLGFNYYNDRKGAYGCSQIANPFSDCLPTIPTSVLTITEDDRWYSLRLGINGVVTLVDRLKLTADAAYLPYVALRGLDNHLLRTDVTQTVSPESGVGQGAQLEAILSYAFMNGFNVGAGARYWAMWTPAAYVNSFGTQCPCQAMPARTERYGGFLQASYKFDVLK
jgi:opacity protein-like surface antigen